MKQPKKQQQKCRCVERRLSLVLHHNVGQPSRTRPTRTRQRGEFKLRFHPSTRGTKQKKSPNLPQRTCCITSSADTGFPPPPPAPAPAGEGVGAASSSTGAAAGVSGATYSVDTVATCFNFSGKHSAAAAAAVVAAEVEAAAVTT